MVLASSLIPGNENAVYRVIDGLTRLGANVVHKGNALVHVSGHCSAGELLYAYNIVKPRNVMPVHGEWRHLRANAALAERTGVPRDRIVLACSALKKIYREHLRAATGGRLAFVYLDGSRELLGRRMGARTGHFMPLGLLDSQLATLEVPTGEPGVVTVSIDQPVEGIVTDALDGLKAGA